MSYLDIIRMDTEVKCLIIVSLFFLCDGRRYCCKDGWTIYNGSCYYFTNHKMTFNEAESNCTRLGSHLIAIETGPEQLFIQEYLKSTFIFEPWIGLTDRAIEGQWIWASTGYKLSFQNWLRGQPNDGTKANCVIIDTSRESKFQWADRPCERELHPSICEQR